MGDLWLLLLLPLSLAALHGVKGCLECDPKFIEDIRTLLTNLVPSEVPGRNQLLERQFKEMTHISFKVSHRDKMLRVLAVQKVVKLRTWLKNEFYRLGNETWKGVFILQGKLLEVRQNLEPKVKETLKAFSEVEEDPRKAEQREIALFLILLAEAGILASAVLLFYMCVTHRRKMQTIRRTLKKYLEKKLEELVGAADEEDKKDSEPRK
ncbi:Izumo sperm-egg fusion protein 3 [Sciurus carolinensis]|uniref:Izumo sperm-egg fusion protein 3 n=1 Tax=Sciurus carolinensis TaxID=30640 RepID=A0AA41T6W6_SCICA|nr:Izumo sperm-egg fusion protein 3 [Sciurus carolinensis]